LLIFWVVALKKQELKNMVFPSITPQGRDDSNCRHTSSRARGSQFCIEPSPHLGAVIEKRVAEDATLVRAEALADEAEALANEAEALPNEAEALADEAEALPNEAEALPNETERRFREQIDTAKCDRKAGKLDDARQQLLVLVFDPCLPSGVIQELAAALSHVDLARFSLSLCERLIDSEWENAETAYDLAVYSSMCGKPQYVTDMYLLKACELQPDNAKYRLAFVCWLLGSQRLEEAIVQSGSPEQFDSNVAVCSDCLSWVIRKFTEQGKAELANGWSNAVSASIREESSACCRNFRGPKELRRAW
jgi:hypothetical protein